MTEKKKLSYAPYTVRRKPKLQMTLLPQRNARKIERSVENVSVGEVANTFFFRRNSKLRAPL